MQALNHTVFGSLIAVTIHDPAIAIPVALTSHFVMDAVPHYGEDPKARRGSRPYYIRIVADLLASIFIVMLFISLHPPNSGLLVACAFLAVMPDFFWPLALFIKQRGPLWGYFRFHKAIQKESRKGIFVELAWFIVTTTLVICKIR